MNDEPEDIDPENPDGEGELCYHCNGSGEGQYDGTRCRWCNGTGEL